MFKGNLEMAKFEWYSGIINNIINETVNIRRFFIEIPELEKFNFKPGQFVMLDLPIDSKKTTRQYSIASANTKDNIVELIIVLDTNGKATNYLFKEVKEKDKVKISSALGKFTLPAVLDKEICFICTGVGIAPFRAMYQEIYKNNIQHKDIHLIFGTRYKDDICYYDELVEMEKKYPEFHFHPVLSRDNSDNWNGNKGYVHDVYKELYKDKRSAFFYICGWRNMIMEAKQNILDLDYDIKDIKYELYD